MEAEPLNKRNGKKTLWIYAVVLFTSAFIVLIITAYSQIKFNKNYSYYKNQLSSSEKEKSKFSLSLNSAQEENKKLADKIVELEKNLEKSKKDFEDYKSSESASDGKGSGAYVVYEILSQAENEFRNNNYVNCALLLINNFRKELLGENGLKIYGDLVSKTFTKAAKLLYSEGNTDYNNSRYDLAIDKFNKSLLLSGNEYFSDDCLYYAAYSEYKLGNKSAAVSYLEQLLRDFPDSGYKSDATQLLKTVSQ